MKTIYCVDTDSLSVIISEHAVLGSYNITEDILVQYDEHGNIVSIVIPNASNGSKFNLNDLLEDLIVTNVAIVTHAKRSMKKCDEKIMNNYFEANNVVKLNIGCGKNILEGWLNSDYYPQSEKILHLDATVQFPFEDDKLDYIFSEHTIEHLTYHQGLKMLQECHRTLKPGGKLRISTPDLSFLIELYVNEKSVSTSAYLQWAKEMFLETAPCFEEVFIINNFVRAWGHKFIYDGRLLRYSLEQAGFEEIVACNLNESSDGELRNLEHTARMPAEFLKMESIIFEGMKPCTQKA